MDCIAAARGTFVCFQPDVMSCALSQFSLRLQVRVISTSNYYYYYYYYSICTFTRRFSMSCSCSFVHVSPLSVWLGSPCTNPHPWDATVAALTNFPLAKFILQLSFVSLPLFSCTAFDCTNRPLRSSDQLFLVRLQVRSGQ